MKKGLFSVCLLIAGLSQSRAYTTVNVQDSISVNTHWTCEQQYLLKGYVYVTAGTILTIDSGVIIKGDKDSKGSLIVERGAQLKAMGTRLHPIVFTSNQPAGSRSYGDWGGVILCGQAPVNWNAGQAQVEGGPRSFYGGSNPSDNSGEMHFCRIEFGGIAFSPNNEINGLTFCGVGAGTQIDHIQVSYSGDDSYEWFGGSVNSKYLVAYAGWDDDFDTDNGYNGKNQFCVGLRDPYAADQSGSKGFESDSYQSGTASGLSGDTSKITKPVFSNCTIIGPLVNPNSTAYDPQFVSGAHIRRGSAISILNSIIAGYPAGVLFDESSSSFGSTIANIGNGILQFRNNIISGIPASSFNKDAMFVMNGARSLTPTTANSDTTNTGTYWDSITAHVAAGPFSFVKNPAFHNAEFATEQTGVRLGNPYNLNNPGMVPTSSSVIVYGISHFASWGAGAAGIDTFKYTLPLSYDTTSPATYNVPAFPPDFTNSKANDAFFSVVNYVGAFAYTGRSTDNWMYGWCNFDPLNENYDVTCYTAPIDSHLVVNNIELPATQAVKVFPNPAHENATVSIEVSHSGSVKVLMLDLSGKLVKTIFNGPAAPGTQSYDFTTNDLANGMYIISVMSEGKHRLLKFAVAK